MAITSVDVSCEKKILKKYEPKSPYLTGDKVQLLSQVTEKKFVKKKTLDYVSSFPLAANIYKASSDEFKSLKRTPKKIKKSVLTLPNQPSPVPQICTVSDMNDSEYYSTSNCNNDKPRLKKRSGIKNVRKPRLKNKELEFYDRDRRYCSQFNVNLEYSSTENVKPYKGDGRRASNLVLQRGSKSSCRPNKNKDQVKPHDVWAVLRNLNRFPFHPSPPMSEESIIGTKKKKAQNKRINCRDARVYETKEFAYISRYELDNNSHSISQSTSFDRVTVIDKQDEFSKICKQFQDRFLKPRNLKDDVVNKNCLEVKNKCKKKIKKNRAIGPPMPKENNTDLIRLNNKDSNLTSQNEQESDKNSCSNNIDDDIHFSWTNVNNTINNKQNVVEHSLVPATKSFTHSDNSGSSKAELSAADTNKLKGTATFGRAPQVKGSSRMNFGKTCNPTSQILMRHPEQQTRKPRLVTTMPSACMMPKLTQTDIKRRLGALRFPIIILGKDQVNSVEIHDYDPPQFNGLDKGIWPFMKKWRANEQETSAKQAIRVTDYLGQLNKKSDISNPAFDSNKVTKNCYEDFINKSPSFKSKFGNTNVATNKNKNEPNSPASALYADINGKREQAKNQKSITQLKDKMLNFLFKKIPNTHVASDDYKNNIPENEPVVHLAQPVIGRPVETVDNCTDAITEPQIKSSSKPQDTVSPMSITKRRKSPAHTPRSKTQQNKLEYPWSNAKRANDFIENVIKKIRTGVYYTQEQKHVKRFPKYTRDATDIAMQTELTSDYNGCVEMDISPKVTIMKKQMYTALPGFETSLAGLEIKTLNMNQIAVKHCVTNIMMQFDVSGPTDNNCMSIMPINTKPLPLVPVEVTESHTKIFKCKTTIVNAMLPAELCSILPKLVRHIDSDVKSLRSGFCSGLINKTPSHLSPIREISIHAANTTGAAVITPKFIKTNVLPVSHISAAVNTYMHGMFSYNMRIQESTTKVNPIINHNNALLFNILPKLRSFDILTYRIRVLQWKYKISVANQSNMACTALEVYSMKNKRLVPVFKPYNLDRIIRDILIKNEVRELNFIPVIPKTQHDSILLLALNLPHDKKLEADMAVQVKSLNTSELSSHAQNNSSSKSIEYIKRSTKRTSEMKRQRSVTDIKVVTNKNKRIGFYRLYRKCKSATTIPTIEKCISKSLNKIQNLDDFFQVLGSKKILATVFDGYAEKKILSSVIEMKNWITDINSKQALLVLLLTNKKDTPNLVRFRPILLQGIAVNRITRATELDMEIEVIERENLNKFREYEGISYLPASVENHDQLLEELYWIAKTTASDYQKPFDESSEKLLKSLLEKRKKLNPSYLRVMARYVGLGLLKQPTRK